MNSIKKSFLCLLLVNNIYAYNYSFIINNNSSCQLKINTSIGNEYIPSAPELIMSKAQAPIKIDTDELDNNLYRKTLVEYLIECGANSSTYGTVGVRIEKDSQTTKITKYGRRFNNKIDVSFDQDSNLVIQDN